MNNYPKQANAKIEPCNEEFNKWKDSLPSTGLQIKDNSKDSILNKSSTHNINIKFLIKYLVSEYGNLNFIVNMSDNLFNFIINFNKNNKNYQNTVNKCKSFLPPVVSAIELFSRIKRYYSFIRTQDDIKSTNDSHSEKIMNYIGCGNEASLYSESRSMGLVIARWLFTSPKTDQFKILRCINFMDGKDCSKLDSDMFDKLVIIEFKNCKIGLYISFMPGSKSISLDDAVFYYSSENSKIINRSVIDLLYDFITKEFLKSLDIKNNMIILSTDGIDINKRLNPVEKSSQIEVESLSNEIRSVLSKGKKRGYIFVGVPGTGKSTVIHILESIITDYPIVYMTTECFSDSYYISEAFKIISYIQPCIVVMEDMDSYNIKSKNTVLGELLERIDDVDNKLNIVLLATINDTSGVHYSLINRPGRFDEVIVIETPKDKNEIYSVMKCRFDKNIKVIGKNENDDAADKKEFMPANKISRKVYKSIIKNKYTHADICEIIEKSLFKSYDITNKILLDSIEILKKSKKAIKDFNFSGNDPNKLNNNH